MKSVTSRQNPIIRRVRQAIREHAGEIVLEGPKPVADAVARGWNPIAILSTDPDDASPAAIHVTAEVFALVTGTRTPQGVIGLFERPRFEAGTILSRRETIAIALDGVQDPGNVGTIVRLAAAFDAAGVLLLPGCADPFSPKAIRSSVGAILDVPVASVTIEELLQAGVAIFTTAAGSETIEAPARDAILVFGSEGSGVSPELLRRSTRIAVPMSPRVESLNVASSAAILLAESYRRRH